MVVEIIVVVGGTSSILMWCLFLNQMSSHLNLNGQFEVWPESSQGHSIQRFQAKKTFRDFHTFTAENQLQGHPDTGQEASAEGR